MTPPDPPDRRSFPVANRRAAVLLLGFLATSRARAEAAPAAAARHPEAGVSLLSFGAAAAGIFDSNPPAMGFLEYRYTTGRYRPGPWLAVEATARDLFIGFGAFLDVPFGRLWVFTPSLGATIYREHDGLGLGYPLEFRSTAELTCRLDRWRFGASFVHFSNGSLGEANPGTEVVKLVWIVPTGRPGPQ